MTHRKNNTVPRTSAGGDLIVVAQRCIFLLIESRAITPCNLAHAGIEGAAIGAHYNMATFSPRWVSQE
jgi:hypothetical protein